MICDLVFLSKGNCLFFYTIKSVAKPKKATKPTTSVTVVRSTPADRAGSEPIFLSSSGMAASIIVLLLLILALVSAAVWWNYHPAAPKLPQRPPSMVMFETHSKRRGSENYTNPLTFKEEKFIELPPRPQKIN